MDNLFLAKALKLNNELVGFRRDFHQYPEIGFKEIRSAKIIASELLNLGYRTTTKVAKTGIIATLGSGKPVIMLRFDMDALPLVEESEHSFVSKNVGVMHACGHDGHMAIGLITARLLADENSNINGTIKLIFQPAEEGLGGAEKMIADGVLGDPTPDFCLGMHIWNDRPLGWVGISPGPIMAGSDYFKITVRGVGGHGAIPHKSKDVLVAASMIVQALQSVISRNVAPLESGVVSVTTINAGDAFNVLPSEAELTGTIRYFTDIVHRLILKRFKEIVLGVASALDCKAEIEISDITPPLVNDNELTSRVCKTLKNMKIFDQIEEKYQTMGSEDMSFFQNKIPGCYIFFGSANQSKGYTYGHHHPSFNFDEDVLPKCAAALTECTLRLTEQSIAD